MGTEIERKFLVNKELWSKVKHTESFHIRQAFLASDSDKLIRIRSDGMKGYITIKGKNDGISRKEFEYEIPVSDANELIDRYATSVIEKIRYIVLHENKIWMVDEFKGKNSDLIIAEIELSHIEEEFNRPLWLGEEVSDKPGYYNINLAAKPFNEW